MIAAVVTPQVTSSTYDAFNRKTQMTQPDPDGAGAETSPVTTYSYDRAGDLLSQTDPNGNVTSTVYDRHARKTEMIQPAVSNGATMATPITSYAYDADGNVISVTDPLSHTTTTSYDALNRKIEVVQPDPDGSGPLTSPTSFSAYDADGNLTKVTDPDGNVTTTAYDHANRKAAVTQPDPDGSGPEASPVTTYAYDADGNQTGVTDPLGHTTTTAYDTLSRKITQTAPDPDGAGPLTSPVTQSGYDLDGNTITTTDPLGHVTTFAYDGLNRKVSETDPDPDGSGALAAPVTTWQYDPAGNMTGMTDPLGNAAGGVASAHTTNYVYDNLNRQTQVIQPSIDGGVTRPTEVEVYDSDGNLLSDTDPDANKTSYAYDALNRQISETDPLGKISTSVYDFAGNVTSTTDRDSRTINYTYDNLNRKIKEEWVGTGAATTWSWDSKGLLTQVSDPASTYSYAYDKLDRPTTLTLSLAGLPTPVVLTESYDAAGNRLNLSANVNGTGDFANSFGYDDLNRLIQVQQANQNTGNAIATKSVNLSFDSASNLTDISRASNLAGTSVAAVSSYGYDNENRLTSLNYTLGASGSPSIDYAFGYDVASRMTALTTPDGISALAYDNDNQLSSASLTGESYTYDANGNRTSASLGTGASGSNSVGGNNELNSDATYAYTYDNEGNLINRTRKDLSGSDTYTWDDRNRLTQVTTRDSSGAITQTAVYAYDDSNDRIRKTILTPAGTTLDERYVYDANGNLLLVLDGATGSVKERYLNGSSENQVFASETGIAGAAAGTTHWLMTDYQGSVRDVAGNSGAVLDHLVYDSFGNVVSQTNSANAPRLGYTGQQVDTETGFNYDHARYYNPTTGTFLNQDPKGFKAGDQNLYRYVDNSPLDGTDPTGMLSAAGAIGAKQTLQQRAQFAAQQQADLNATATTLQDASGVNGGDVASAFWGGAAQGAGHAVANGVVGVGLGAKEIGLEGADAANSYFDLATDGEVQLYKGNLSHLGDASMSTDFSIGGHAAEAAANFATAGTYGEVQATGQYLSGQIGEDQYSQQMFGTGLFQAGGGVLAKGTSPEGSPQLGTGAANGPAFATDVATSFGPNANFAPTTSNGISEVPVDSGFSLGGEPVNVSEPAAAESAVDGWKQLFHNQQLGLKFSATYSRCASSWTTDPSCHSQSVSALGLAAANSS